MKLTQVKGVNVKGRSFTHELKSFNIISGENATGKTAITEAVKLAVIGYIPNLGKRNSDSIKLAGNGSFMSAHVMTEEGQEIGVSFNLGKKVTKTLTDDRAPEFPLAALNSSAFMDASAKDKIALVASCLPPVQGLKTPAEFFSEFKAENGTFEDFERISDSTVVLMRKAAEELNRDIKSEKKTLSETLVGIEDLKDSDHVEIVTKESVEIAESAESELRDRLGAKREKLRPLKDLEVNEPECFELTKSDVIELEDIRDAIKGDQHQENISKQENLKQSWVLNNNQKKDAKKAADEARSALIAVSETESVNDQSIKEFTDLGVDERDSRFAEMNESLTKLESERQSFQDQIATAQLEIQTLKKRVIQFSGDSACDCPTCGTSDVAKTVVSLANTRISQLESEIEDLRSKRDVKAKESLKACDLMTAVEQQIILTAKESLINHHQSKLDEIEKEGKLIAAEIESVNTRFIKAKEEASEASEKLKSWVAWNKWLEVHIEAASLEHDIQEIEKELSEASEKVKEMRDKFAESSKAVSAKEQQKKASERLEKIGKELDILKSFIEEAKKAEEAESLAAFASVTHAVKPFFKDIVEGDLILQGSELGVMREGQFIYFDTLSGAEQLVVAASLKAALATLSPVKLLIVDETTRMTRGNREIFCDNVREALSVGLIDQAILIESELSQYTKANIISTK